MAVRKSMRNSWLICSLMLNKVDQQHNIYYQRELLMRNNHPSVSYTTNHLFAKILLFFLLIQISICCEVAHCKTCNRPSTCQMCKKYYCLKRGGTCTQCDTRMPNCITCSSCTVCTSCTYDARLTPSDKCQKCSVTMPRCLTCQSFTVCTSCIAGNYMVGNTCCQVPMPYCTGCVAKPTACDNCISNQYCRQSVSSCIPCWSPMPNCQTCSSCNTCLTCINNNYAITSTFTCALCSQLMAKCVKCSSSTVCIECLAPFYGIDAVNNCQNCEVINPNCRTCISNTHCITCISTFYGINSINMCELCSALIPNCIRCVSAVVCLLCDPGYTVNPSFLCQLCTDTMDNCGACSSIYTCTACMNGLVLVGMSSCCTVAMPFCKGCKNDTSKCDQCINDKYMFATITSCTQCYHLIPFCSTCSSNGTICYNCFLGYVFNGGGACQTCGDFVLNCGTCNTTPACLTCINNQYVLNNTLDCDLCSQYLSNCKTCSSKLICTSCQNDTYALSTANICLTCDTFLSSLCINCYNNSACKTCQELPNIFLTSYLKCRFCNELIPYCLVCEDQNRCRICADEYGMKMAGTKILCHACSWMMFGCATCHNSYQCTKCIAGKVVMGGCSTVNGCVRVDASVANSPCVACDTTQFFYDPINDKCECFYGHLAGFHCTDIIGCTTVQRLSNGTQFCVVCDKMNKFIPKNGRCQCERYYEIVSNTCTQICGDGKRINNQCDDGNKISGDGCSATCKIEYKYSCSDDARGRSHCVYDGNIVMKFLCVYKLTEPNTVEITFSVRPYIKNLQEASSNAVVLTPSNILTVSKAQFVDQKLIVKALYTQNIDGKKVNLKYVFNKQLIKSKSILLPFYLQQCKGKSLDFQRVPTSFNDIMKEVTRYLTIAALCSLLLGSFATRMIGVETINALQLIAMSQAYAPKYYPTVEGMNGLTHVIGGFQNILTNSTIIDSPVEYQKLNYSASFIGNTLLILLFQLISLALYGILFLIEHLQCLSSIKKKCSLDKRMLQAKQFIYRFLIFPSYIGFIFNMIIATTCLTLRVIDKSQNSSYTWQSSITLFSFISCTLIFYHQWKYLFIINKRIENNHLQKPKYIAIYLTYAFVTNIMMQLSLLDFIQDKLYSMVGVLTIYLLVLLIYRPYNSVFHNVVVIFNQVGVLAAFLWFILQKFYVFERDKEEKIGYGIVSIASLILLLSTIRSIIQIKKRYFALKIIDIQNASTTSKQGKIYLQNKRKESQDDYLRGYYPKQNNSNIEGLLLQKMSHKFNGIQYDEKNNKDYNASIFQASKFKKNEGSYEQKNKYRLKKARIQS